MEQSDVSEELLVAISEIKQMESCRIKAKNRDFYLHKYKVEKIISKYENARKLSPSNRQLLTKAQSALAFARTDYLMQVGRTQAARNVMDALASNTTLNIYSDTTQWLDFLYHQGRVKYHQYNIKENAKSILQGYDCVIQGYFLTSRTNRQQLFKAQYMQLLSVYLLNDSIFSLVNKYDRASIRYINEDSMPDSLLAGNLAERALDIFLAQSHAYHTADAWLNLARCHFQIGNPRHSIECLNMAIANPETDSMPDLLASINEQLSLSYAALDDKHNSDFYRNAYLDLQDSTRQDRELEARVIALQESTTKIWFLAAIIFAIFIMLAITTIVLTRIRRRKQKNANEEKEILEQLNEQLQTRQLQYNDALRSAVEQRARLFVINGMVPLIDRMKIAIYKGDDTYAAELAKEIETQNEMLTKWIKLRKGIIQPKIEKFPLQDILNVISKNSKILNKQNIHLEIPKTDINVKADKTLTLFIVNTIIDNARKAIEGQGIINVTCLTNIENKYVEISVTDNGKGMTEQEVEHLFEYKVIQDTLTTKSHGFGLANCRGIIDRYRKISSIFAVCSISAKSKKGSGTTISFRLPIALKTLIILTLCTISSTFTTIAARQHNSNNDSIAARYCDSLYKCNINGQYTQSILYADSCYEIIKNDSSIDVGIKLSLYNETAVAALALHKWDEYNYFNYLFTNLYKEYTTDSTLPLYCKIMERNELIANGAILIVLVLIATLIPIFWFTYLRHLIKFHREIRYKRQELKEVTQRLTREYNLLHLVNNITDNQLSAMKHETMYYPIRIQHLINNGGDKSDIIATVDYYRDLYCTLALHATSKQTATLSFHIENVSIVELFPDITLPAGTNDITILANKELMLYMKTLLRRQNGGETPKCKIHTTREKYATISFYMNGNKQLTKNATLLFSTATPNIDFLIIRQIVREIVNTTMQYAAGIQAIQQKDITVIEATLPYKNIIGCT